jgi:hypothetical protein
MIGAQTHLSDWHLLNSGGIDGLPPGAGFRPLCAGWVCAGVMGAAILLLQPDYVALAHVYAKAKFGRFDLQNLRAARPSFLAIGLGGLCVFEIRTSHRRPHYTCPHESGNRDRLSTTCRSGALS